jgi:hypothetical protein
MIPGAPLAVRLAMEVREFIESSHTKLIDEVKVLIETRLREIPAGPQGEKGDPGEASTAPGPQGEKGEPGEVDPAVLATLVSGAVAEAMRGLDMEALRGPSGKDGVDGKGEKGDRGEKGDPGVGERGKRGEKGDRGDPGRDGVATRDELHELIKAGVAGAVAAIVPEITEAVRKTLPKVEFQGVYREGTEYTKGDLVTFGGSVWHCDVEQTTVKPDSIDPKHWTLAVKKGRDAR